MSDVPGILFSEGKIGNLVLRNRIIKAGCFEGMSQGGGVTPSLITHHREIAAGGTAMTTVAYCSVSFDGRAYAHELWMQEKLIPDLIKITDQVHQQGAAASIQLGHCGYFASKSVIGKRPVGASPKFNLFRLSRCREMSITDIKEKTDDFVHAADIAIRSGFDAIEIHAGHGYLISQFISPFTNKRNDKYGGSLQNRMRFPVEVIRRIRESTGPGFPILIKMNLMDGMKGGLGPEESLEVAKLFEEAGTSALIPSSGFTSKTPLLMLRGKVPLKEMVANQSDWLMKIGIAMFGKIMVKEYAWSPLFHFEQASEIRKAVSIPVIYIGGVQTLRDVKKIFENGFEFVQVGRALIHDPDFSKKLESGALEEPFCDQCNRCVTAMDKGGVYCVSKEKGYRS